MKNEKIKIYTRGGGLISPFALKPEDVDIDVIAHSLSNLCRFGGHTRHFYSVAEHSVAVSELCSPENQLAGLLHDAAEAYIGDIVRPIKAAAFYMPDGLHGPMEEIAQVEDRILAAVLGRFNLDPVLPDEVILADNAIMVEEADRLIFDLGPVDPNEIYLPARARELFLRAFDRLTIPIREEAAA